MPNVKLSYRKFSPTGWAIAILMVVSLVLTGCVSTATSGTGNQKNPAAQSAKVSADEALKILKDNSLATLLDVRTPEEFKAGHINGASNLAVEELIDRQDELPQDKEAPIIVYCHSGRRSALAATDLINLGYTAVYDLGGIQDWPYEIVK